jgi:hypothetical protein
MPQAIAPEMDKCVHDPCGDIHPRQDLHRWAGEARNHGGQTGDVEEDGGFEQVGKVPGGLGASLRFRLPLINTKIRGGDQALAHGTDAGAEQRRQYHGGEYDHRKQRVNHVRILSSIQVADWDQCAMRIVRTLPGPGTRVSGPAIRFGSPRMYNG